MQEELYYMLFLIIIIIIIYRIRIILLIKLKIRELRNKRHGLVLSNKIITIDYHIIKKNGRNYTFSLWGFTELGLRYSDKIEVGFVQMMPLEVNFTQIFANYLVKEGLGKKHDSKEDKLKFKEKIKNLVI